MKTAIVINIGLTDKNNSPVELHRAIHAIESTGVSVLSSGVVAGEWEGKPEQTLVIGGLALASDELTRRLYAVSAQLSQHCIAVWHDGRGELIGDNPEGWTFNAELFHFHPREAAPPELSPCQEIQARHRARVEKLEPLLVSGYNAPVEKPEPLSIAELKRRIEFLEDALAYFENLATERKERLDAHEK